MENLIEETFLRIKFEEPGKICLNRIVEMPKCYKDFLNSIKENFKLEENENIFYSISYKDIEGDFLDISNSLDFDQALKSFENSKKNYLKIKITKKDKDAKESRFNSEFDYIEYDSCLRRNNDFKCNLLDDSNVLNQSNEKKESTEDRIDKKNENSIKMMDKKPSDKDVQNDQFEEISNENFSLQNKMCNDDNKIRSENITMNQKKEINCINKEKLFSTNKNQIINENTSNFKFTPEKTFENENYFLAGINNNLHQIKNNIIINDKNNPSNKQQIKKLENEINRKDELEKETRIYNNKQKLIRSKTQSLIFIKDQINTDFNNRIKQLPNEIKSQISFENYNQNILGAIKQSEKINKINQEKINDLNIILKKNQCQKNNKFNKKKDEAIDINNKIELFGVEDQKDSNFERNRVNPRVKCFEYNKNKRNSIDSDNFSDEDYEKRPGANYPRKQQKNRNFKLKHFKKQNTEKKIKEINKNKNCIDSEINKIQILEEKLKLIKENNKKSEVNYNDKKNNINKKINYNENLDNLVYEKTKKGFEKLLIKKINKMINKELKFTQDILYKKSKNLIQEFLKDYEYLIKSQKIPFKISNDKIPSLDKSHLIKQISNSDKNLHFGVQCKSCNEFPIKGIRYKCSVCAFLDLCGKCEENLGSIHIHDFIKIRNPNQTPKLIQTLICNNKSFSDKKILKNNKNKNDENKYNFYVKKFYSNNNFDRKIIQEFNGNKNVFMEKTINFPELLYKDNLNGYNDLNSNENAHINIIMEDQGKIFLDSLSKNKEMLYKNPKLKKDNELLEIKKENMNDNMPLKFCADRKNKDKNNQLNFNIQSNEEKEIDLSNYSKSSKLLNQNSIDFVDKSFCNLFNSSIGSYNKKLLITKKSDCLYKNENSNKEKFENEHYSNNLKVVVNQRHSFKDFIFPIKLKNTSNQNFPKPCYLICDNENSDIVGKTIPIQISIKPGMIINFELILNFKNTEAIQKQKINKISESIWDLKDSLGSSLGKKIKIIFEFNFEHEKYHEKELKEEIERKASSEYKINESNQNSFFDKKPIQQNINANTGILSLEEFKKLKLRKIKNNTDKNNIL